LNVRLKAWADVRRWPIGDGHEPAQFDPLDTRDLRSNARTLPGINCGTFQTDNAAQGSSLTA